MVHPNEHVSSLVYTAINAVRMGDHNNKELCVFFRKQDLSEYGEYKVRDLFDGNETIYVKEVEAAEEAEGY